MRLLVVEDDPDLNRQLTKALTDAGYVVDRAFDGEEGHYLGEGEPGPSVAALLAISTGLAILILAVIWFVFFRT